MHIEADTEQLAVRLDEVAQSFRALRESFARTAPAMQRSMRRLGESMERSRAVRYGTRDAMNWSPPADGEETPPCPA
jgi:hypothetical protein